MMRTTNYFHQNVTTPNIKLKTRHVQILLIFTGIVLNFAIRVALSVAIISMTSYGCDSKNTQIFNWTPLQISLILSSFGWGYILTQIPSIYWVHLYSNKLLFSGSTFICGLIHGTTPILADAFGWFAVLFSRIIIGFFQGCILSCTKDFIAQWSTNKEKKRIDTIMFIAADIGTVLGFFLAGLLTIEWLNIFYTLGTITVLWSIICYKKCADSPNEHPTISEEEIQYITENSNKVNHIELSQLVIPWKKILSSLAFWILVISNCGYQWIRTFYLIELPAYLQNSFDNSIQTSSLMSTLPFLASLTCAAPAAWIFDQLSSKSLSKSLLRKTANTVTFWGLSTICISLAFAQFNDTTVTMLLLIIGNCMSVCHFAGFLISHLDISPKLAPITIAIANTIGTIFMIFEPLVNKMFIRDTTNVYQWQAYFTLSAYILFLSNFIFLIWSRFEIQSWNTPVNKIQINSVVENELLAGNRRISIIEETIVLYM